MGETLCSDCTVDGIMQRILAGVGAGEEIVNHSACDGMKQRPLMPALAIFSGPVLVFLIAVILVIHSRGVPDNDYWGLIPFNAIIGVPSISDFYARSNEHIIAGAKIFYLMNYYTTGGDNLGLSLIACAFSLIIATLIAWCLSRYRTANLEIFIAGALSAVLVFSPLASHNFFLGMSGVAWIGSNLFTVLAAFCLWRAAENNVRLLYVLSLACALIAFQFYSTGLTALYAIGTQAMCARKTRKIGVIFFLAGLAFVICMAIIQEVPGHHQARSFNPVKIALFCFTFLGAGVSNSKGVAMALGVAGSIMTALIVRRTILSKDDNLFTCFWIALIAYAALSSGIVAIGRSNMGGTDVALSSRYATLPALFWIGVFGAGTSAFRGARFVRAGSLIAFATAIVLVVVSGLPGIEYRLARASGKDLTTLALSMGVKDASLMKYVTPVPHQYYAAEAQLEAVHHVPFNGRDFGCIELGVPLETGAPAENMIGSVDAVNLIEDPQWAKVRGWTAYNEVSRPPLLKSDFFSTYDCVAIMADNGTVVGFAIGGFRRPELKEALKTTRDDYGWVGYANLPLLSNRIGPVHLYAAIKTSAGWVKLPKSVELGPTN